jgi:hypothetical protein
MPLYSTIALIDDDRYITGVIRKGDAVMTAAQPATNVSLPARPAELNLQRKAAIVAGGAVDHAGRVRIARMEGFDMGRTIFGSLEGRLPRMMMNDKLGKEAFWSDRAVASIESAFDAAEAQAPSTRR